MSHTYVVDLVQEEGGPEPELDAAQLGRRRGA